jgi:hypothetical protein
MAGFRFSGRRLNNFRGRCIMAQVTIYIDAETEKKMQAIVKKSGVSKSKWITDLIREKTANTWSDIVKEAAGTWGDFPLAQEIRNNLGTDPDREPM